MAFAFLRFEVAGDRSCDSAGTATAGFDDFSEAIDEYKVPIARSLRYGKNYHQKTSSERLSAPTKDD
jgi:hypothetical protein